MTISLHDATVAGFLQTLTAVAGYLEKGRAHCEANGIDLASVVDTRLYPDMAPFRFQLLSVVHHSKGAIEGVQAGAFSPPTVIELDYAGLQAHVEGARTMLKALTRDDVEALQDKDVVFSLGPNKLPFTGGDFLLSFSMPNFHFHATTAYDILRTKGVPIGKRDYMGPLRMKR